ncbi:TPR_REGION domain-containing protein [Caerostris darwini]|uniref:TPR_REGION domain-containing protein n=1 Tax=Caerostris darwini TaxID=1538125 RepID=A0AAV4SKD6_9ARAC|nr:TPR_REGION domain-containing protein [Caerostris darwini]
MITLSQKKMNLCNQLENGQKLIDMKQYDDAQKLFSHMASELEKQENFPQKHIWLSEIYNNLGFLLYKKVEFNKAQSFYKKSMEINPSFAPAYYNYGVIDYRLSLFESAIRYFRKAVQLNPENPEFAAGLQASEIALYQNNELIT